MSKKFVNLYFLSKQKSKLKKNIVIIKVYYSIFNIFKILIDYDHYFYVKYLAFKNN
jgi:hypothetical protein